MNQGPNRTTSEPLLLNADRADYQGAIYTWELTETVWVEFSGCYCFCAHVQQLFGILYIEPRGNFVRLAEPTLLSFLNCLP